MKRIRLLANCMAGPTGCKFRGYERDADDATAAVLVATHQWEIVQPPNPEPGDARTARPDADWTEDTPAAIAADGSKAKRRIGVK
jgi:hypothetical protein